MLLGMFGIALMGAPSFAAQQAGPGTVNYVEGAAYIEGAQLNPKDVGDANLDAGQILTTGKGKAEILLTPGVFLRVDDNSAIKMISPDLTLTQVELVKGRAGIEVDQIHDQNNLQLIDAGVTTRLEKTGYYQFDANNPTAMVFKGKAAVELSNGRVSEIKGHHELILADTAGKTHDFDADKVQDELYNWSSLRSQYLAESNNQVAGKYNGEEVNPGWFWNPYSYGYTYIGMGPFASPFGWGFYPFGWGGLYGPGYYGGGYYGRGYYSGHYGHSVGGYAHGPSSGFHSVGTMGGGIHSGGGRR
jgi:hypothetical protein